MVTERSARHLILSRLRIGWIQSEESERHGAGIYVSIQETHLQGGWRKLTRGSRDVMDLEARATTSPT